MRRDNRTEKGIKRKKRRKKRYLLRFIILVAICVSAAAVAHLEYFDVTEIAVTGNEEISDEEILKLSGVSEGMSIFDVHPIFVKHRIRENLYLEEVKVRRTLPGNVTIEVREKDALAQFTMGKKYVVTDNEGTVVEVSDEMRKVTLVDGQKVESAEKGKPVKTSNEALLKKTLSLIKTVAEGDLYFSELSVKDGRVTAVLFDELRCEGKYDDMVESIENKTLISVAYDLYQKDTVKGVITVESNGYCFFTPQK